MGNIGLLGLAIGFVVAWVIGYLAHKNSWKIGKIF